VTLTTRSTPFADFQEESNLGEYDIEVGIDRKEAAFALRNASEAQGTSEAPGRISSMLRLLVITPSMMLREVRPATCERLDHFNVMTGGKCSAIVFLLDCTEIPGSAVHPELCYADLQYAMQSHKLEMPCLLLDTATALPQVMKRFGKELTKDYISIIPIANAAVDVVKHCTIDPIMDDETFTAVTDTFPNLKELAGIESGNNGVQRLIAAGANPDRAEAAAKFWDEEYIAE
jgi:hypothetical protein